MDWVYSVSGVDGPLARWLFSKLYCGVLALMFCDGVYLSSSCHIEDWKHHTAWVNVGGLHAGVFLLKQTAGIFGQTPEDVREPREEKAAKEKEDKWPS